MTDQQRTPEQQAHIDQMQKLADKDDIRPTTRISLGYGKSTARAPWQQRLDEQNNR